MTLHIGVDFDNTIAIYDEVFHRQAIDVHAMPADIAPDKPSIRAYYWGRPGGREEWIELQGIVYGTKMAEARVAPGFSDFARWCLDRDIDVSIISHKTVYSAGGPRVSLHEAAWQWLYANGFFEPGVVGLDREAVFFEPKREDKLARIVSQGCAAFVDDLPEIFADSHFPDGVLEILYDPKDRSPHSGRGLKSAHWREIEEEVRRMAEDRGL